MIGSFTKSVEVNEYRVKANPRRPVDTAVATEAVAAAGIAASIIAFQ